MGQRQGGIGRGVEAVGKSREQKHGGTTPNQNWFRYVKWPGSSPPAEVEGST